MNLDGHSKCDSASHLSSKPSWPRVFCNHCLAWLRMRLQQQVAPLRTCNELKSPGQASSASSPKARCRPDLQSRLHLPLGCSIGLAIASGIARDPGIHRSASTVGSSSGGFSSASIHGIGESRTLVLLDGHRVATWAGQSLTGSGAGIDLNSIPLAAVERIEVLTDGASALYGSDAIAGVVNFILKKNSTEGVAQVSLTQPTQRGGAIRSVSLTKGVGDLDRNGYNLLLSYSHDDQQALAARNRSFSRSNTIPFTYGGQNLAFVSGSQYTTPATVQAADGSWHNPLRRCQRCLPAWQHGGRQYLLLRLLRRHQHHSRAEAGQRPRLLRQESRCCH